MSENKETKLGLTEEDIRREEEENRGPAGLFWAMGDENIDAAAIAASEDGRIFQERMIVMSFPEDSEESKNYWASYEKGLEKELHGDPADKLNRWASYLPLSAVEQMENGGDRKYPLIFCLHGANNPIQLTETYGIIQVAAREECIVIAPENENLDNILSLLDYAKAHWPVDEGRVYSIGYSFGGFMSSRNTLARPDIFAGVGMGGMLFAGDMPPHELAGQPYPEYKLTQEMLDRAREVELPALLFMGENEMLCLEPLWREPKAAEVRDGAIPLSSADKHRAFNRWRHVGGCAPYEFKEGSEFYESSADPTVKSIGAEFERTEVREYHGRKYFIGDSVNEKGECLFRTVSCEKMAHWPTAPYGELVWEHIGKFARDTETGKLIRL